MFKFLSLALAISPLAVSGQVIQPSVTTTCETYVFQCGTDVYQCGANLGFAAVTSSPDSCDHGGQPTYRPMPLSDCTRLIDAVKNARYSSTTTLEWRHKCRETHNSNNGIMGTGSELSSWGCYNNAKPSLSMVRTDTSGRVQRTCEKTKSYFTNFEPFLGKFHKCGCGSSTASCAGVDASTKCQPGDVCAPVTSTYSSCRSDPKADHNCCHSMNFMGKDVKPGTCCKGGKAMEVVDKFPKCVVGNENKTIAYTGICPVGAVETRKTNVMEGNLCLQTPDLQAGRPSEFQGECMTGLKCNGSNGYGFCEWWKKSAWLNSCNLEVWRSGCEPGDCQAGTYCHHWWKPNGSLQFTECRPLTPGMPDLEAHDGICKKPIKDRAFRQSLGTCTGEVGNVWGDPHVVTFDDLKYDCMASGDFVFTENCLFKLHGRLDGMEDQGMKVSQTKAIAVQTGHRTPSTSDDSLLQFYMPHKWELNKTNILADAYQVYQGDCPVRILSNGVPLGKPPVDARGKLLHGVTYITTPLFSITTEVVLTTDPTSIGDDYLVVNYANGGTARIRIRGDSVKWKWGCSLSVEICLPKNADPNCYTDTTGLMGTPDGDRANDWMLKKNQNQTKNVYVPFNISKSWDYCTENWCIPKGGGSILPSSETGIPGVMSLEWYSKECLRPFPGTLNVTYCYAIERCDKFLLAYPNVKKGITPQANLPPEYISCCVECINGPEDANCKGEEQNLVKIIEDKAVTPDGKPPTLVVVPEVTCTNLGSDLSGPTGFNAWPGETQVNVQCSNSAKCIGYDDSWSVFVGGDLIMKRAEFIEGRTYVGGNFKTYVTEVENDSLKYLGWAPCGSQMCPNTMMTALEVCGNMDLAFGSEEGVDIMMMEGMSAFVSFGGTFKENGIALPVTKAGSEMIVDTTMLRSQGVTLQAQNQTKTKVCSKKDKVLVPLKAKSAYWASQKFKSNNIFINGTITVNEITKEVVLNAPAGVSGCTIVIDLAGSILNRGTGLGWSIVFGDQINARQTVLINVSGKTVAVKGFLSMVDKIDDNTTISGYNFDNGIMTKTMWNFFEATSVVFDSPSYVATDRTSFEWQGSILAPLADVEFYIKSHLGRMVVGGKLTVDHPDAGFMNFMFNPKGDKCELPKDPTDSCEPVLPTPPLTMLEPECVLDSYIKTDTGSTICKKEGTVGSIVKMDGQLGFDGSKYSNGDGIFYGLKMSADGSTVQFNVNNPFSEKADIYVKHETFLAGTSWLDPACEANFQQSNCLTKPYAENGGRQFEVACMEHGNGHKYAQVYVFFATTSPEVTTYTGGDKLDHVDACCHPSEYDPFHGFVEFMYKIDCECPTPTAAAIGNTVRKVRRN